MAWRAVRRWAGLLVALCVGLALCLPGAARAADTPPQPPTWSGKVAPLNTPWTTQVTPDNALPDYPRPQLARPSVAAPEWTNLNGLWQYQPTDGYSSLPFGKNLKQQILVPYPTESALSGIQAHSDFMVYRRSVTVPAAYTAGGRHVRLNFGAVSYEATVYVNKKLVAHHTGGYTAFSADITSALKKNGANEILVAVHAPVDGADIPVGKQSLKPGGIFYTASSGIWQTVWMEPVQPASIASVVATARSNLKAFDVKATFNGSVANAVLKVTAFADGKAVASSSGSATGTFRLNLPKPRLWSPTDPFLYTFKVSLTKNGRTDTVASYAGLRTIAVKNVDGKQRIVLNGKPTFLLGTLDQGFWPDGIYTAPTDDALKFDIQKTKDLGFNTIRKHIKIEPARWYYWADKLGLMVWQDAPSLPAGNGSGDNASAQADFRSEVSAMVNQLKGETSIIGWIPFNEGWGQWSVQAAADVTAQIKAIDPTRLVNSRSGANCCETPGDPGSGNIIDWHVYQGPALPAPDATRASIDGEHGGLTLSVEGHRWPGADVNPYGSVPDAAALTKGYVENTSVLRDVGAPYGLSGSIYTQITDVEGEQNGLFTYDRKVEKPDEAAVRAINLQTIAAGSQPIPAPPAGTPGLEGVGHWKLDDGSGTTAADSAGNHPLTLSGATWSPDGLVFNGSASATTDGPVLNTRGTNFSVAAWVKADQFGGGFQTVVSEDGENNSAFFLQYSGQDQRWAFSFVGARAIAADLGQPQPGRWYHLVGVRDTVASTLTIYVDGQKAGTTSVLGTADVGTGSFAVGRGKYGGKPVDFLTGTVDDVRAYDRALSADEVATLFAAGRP